MTRWGEGRRWETGAQGISMRRHARLTYAAHGESETTAAVLETDFRLTDLTEARELLWAAWAEIEDPDDDDREGGTWYSIDPENGIELHGSATEARATARENMQYYGDCAAQDRWHEGIGSLSWGKLMPHEKACLIQEGPGEEEEDWSLQPV